MLFLIPLFDDHVSPPPYLPSPPSLPSVYTNYLVDGKAYMWGNNQWGRLGLGPDFTDSSVSTPMLCTSLQDAFVSDVAIGSSHGLALATPNGSKETIDGKQVAHAFSWGLGREAQLGLGDYVNTDVPTMVELEGGHGLAVAAGAHHSLVLAQMLN